MCRYDSGGAAAGVTTLTSGSGGGGGKADRRITLAMIKDEGLGTAGANAWVQVCALIVYTPLLQIHQSRHGLCRHDTCTSVRTWTIWGAF